MKVRCRYQCGSSHGICCKFHPVSSQCFRPGKDCICPGRPFKEIKKCPMVEKKAESNIELENQKRPFCGEKNVESNKDWSGKPAYSNQLGAIEYFAYNFYSWGFVNERICENGKCCQKCLSPQTYDCI